MHIRPILSTLSRHKTAAALIVLEIALSCAILCNALFIVSLRLDAIAQPSGLDDAHLVSLRPSAIGPRDNAMARTSEDLAALAAIPGVVSATITNQLPFQGSAWNTSLSSEPDAKGVLVSAGQYGIAPGGLDTLGLQLVAGRAATAEEHMSLEQFGQRLSSGLPFQAAVVITQSIADALLPGQQAVGRQIYIGPYALNVVGVVQTLKRPNGSFGRNEHSLIMPMTLAYTDGGTYVLRVADPAQRQQVLDAATKALLANDPDRLIRDARTFEQHRAAYFSNDRDMVGLLLVVSVLLLLVTALGIVGLASFWVGQRTKQIGIRRALGATGGQIQAYFLTENALLTSGGIVIGMLLTYGLNQWLMSHYSLPRLPWQWLPVGAVVLWLLGLASVYGPARRAASIPPAVATRTS